MRPEYEWPRIVQYLWSDPLAVFPKTGIAGRGTQEMKTKRLGEGYLSPLSMSSKV